MPWTIGENWLILLVPGVVVLAFAFGYASDAIVARRIFAQFFAMIFLPLIVLLGGPLIALSFVVDLDERVWQAFIAGLVVAAGWLTTAIFAELSRARGKAERLRDTHKAIYAEIGYALSSLYDDGKSEGYAEDLVQRMRSDATLVPFIPKEHHDHIFDAVLDEIEVLPRQTIDAIVAYYSQIKSLSALAEDMRGEGFRALSQDRRILMYEDYLSMRRSAFASGEYALALIAAYADGGSDAAEAEKRRYALSSRVSGRSGPEAGSG